MMCVCSRCCRGKTYTRRYLWNPIVFNVVLESHGGALAYGLGNIAFGQLEKEPRVAVVATATAKVRLGCINEGGGQNEKTDVEAVVVVVVVVIVVFTHST